MIGEGFPLLNAYDRADSQGNADRNMLRGLVVNLLDISERALSGEVDPEELRSWGRWQLFGVRCARRCWPLSVTPCPHSDRMSERNFKV